MSDAANKTSGPDLTEGIAESALVDGAMLGGHVGDDAVLLARRGDEFFAIGAACTHYNGPLGEGLLVGDTSILFPTNTLPSRRSVVQHATGASAGARSASP